jgi:hypothetical protein
VFAVPIARSTFVTERLPPPREDRDRAERIRRGDAGAFEALFREHHAGLCHFAKGYVRPRLHSPLRGELGVLNGNGNLTQSRRGAEGRRGFLCVSAALRETCRC